MTLRFCLFILCLATVSGPASAQSSEKRARESIVRTALSFKGVSYVYGASSPTAFDCSGFVRFVYRKALGVEIPRTSKALYSAGAPIRPEQAKPGDVLVFDTEGGTPSHVAIVVDKGTMIHAASEGPQTGVIVSPLNDAYFAPRLIGARVLISGPAAARGADKAAPNARQKKPSGD